MIGLFKTYFDEETKIGGGFAVTDIKKGTLVSPQGEIIILYRFYNIFECETLFISEVKRFILYKYNLS